MRLPTGELKINVHEPRGFCLIPHRRRRQQIRAVDPLVERSLEFMVSHSEARLNMVRMVSGRTEVRVRACLEGMGELDEDQTDGLEAWLGEDVKFPPFTSI